MSKSSFPTNICILNLDKGYIMLPYFFLSERQTYQHPQALVRLWIAEVFIGTPYVF